jgi:hypothetical protein
LHDLGNVAAVCRTAEALGYGAMHLVHEQHMESYKRSRRSSAGAEKWSELHRWSDSKACLTTLKSAGYRILVRRPYLRIYVSRTTLTATTDAASAWLGIDINCSERRIVSRSSSNTEPQHVNKDEHVNKQAVRDSRTLVGSQLFQCVHERSKEGAWGACFDEGRNPLDTGW